MHHSQAITKGCHHSCPALDLFHLQFPVESPEAREIYLYIYVGHGREKNSTGHTAIRHTALVSLTQCSLLCSANDPHVCSCPGFGRWMHLPSSRSY